MAADGVYPNYDAEEIAVKIILKKITELAGLQVEIKYLEILNVNPGITEAEKATVMNYCKAQVFSQFQDIQRAAPGAPIAPGMFADPDLLPISEMKLK